MKKDTMKKLMALPKDAQDKVWKLAMERLKTQGSKKNEASPAQDKKTAK